MLTHPEKQAILKQVILGADAPPNEPPEAAAWRKECESDVAKTRAQGMMPELPWDVHDPD